jgi:putative hemolysin
MENKIKCKKTGILLVSLAFVVLLISLVNSLMDPAAVFCQQMGYTITVENSPEGQIGICKFSQTQNCSASKFLVGECGQKYHYCTKNGYGLKTVEVSENCSVPFLAKCAMCVMENGEEISATTLMVLDIKEWICGDGKCDLGETKYTCPSDCNKPSSVYASSSGLGVIKIECNNECENQTINVCGKDKSLYDCLPDVQGCLKIKNNRTCWETEECVNGIGCVESVQSKGFWISMIDIVEKIKEWFAQNF